MDGPAALGDARHRRIDIAGVEVKQPRLMRQRIVHQAAGLDAVRLEGLVDAHGPHVDGGILFPAEAGGIEIERRRSVARMIFIPAAMAHGTGGAGREGHALHTLNGGGRGHDIDQRALRVGHHGHAADVGNVVGRPHGLAAGRFEGGDLGVDIGHIDIGEPAGRHAGRFGGHGHHAAYVLVAGADLPVVHAVRIAGDDGPAGDPAVEGNRRVQIRRDQFVPDKVSGHRFLRCLAKLSRKPVPVKGEKLAVAQDRPPATICSCWMMAPVIG